MKILSPETGSKKMNKNILVVLGGAILAAVLVAVLVQVTLGGKKSAPTSLEVLVAAQNIKKGSKLGEGDLRWKGWSEDALFKGMIIRKDDKDADDVLKGRLERSFKKGEAVVRSAILKTKGNYVVARLKEGERAVSVKLKAEDMVAGFIAPGSYVDVIFTYNKKVNFGANKKRGVSINQEIPEMIGLNLEKIATETILENVRVLAVDQKAEQKKDDKIKVGKTITLALSIKGAEKLTLASQMGRVTLAMRGVGDDLANAKDPVTSDARLVSIDDEIHAEYLKLKNQGNGSRSGSVVAGGSGNAVKVYNGAQVVTVPVH